MKYNVQNLALLSAVISFASCQQNKQVTIDESGNEVIKLRKPTQDTVIPDTIITPAAAPQSTDEPVKPVPAKPNPTFNPSAAIVKSDEMVKPGRAITIKGVVKDINHGKDGYTARIETTDGQIVAATISRANLSNPKSYREMNVGETVKVSGNTWILDGVNQLTVRSID